MTTLTDVEARYGDAVTYLEHLDRDAAIPVVDRIAAQGDVLLRRIDGHETAATPIPAAGYPVVRGENGGNTHLLIGPGHFDPRQPGRDGLRLGVLTVPAGAQVLLTHPEHGGLLIEPGTYEIRRQREQADEIRLVAD